MEGGSANSVDRLERACPSALHAKVLHPAERPTGEHRLPVIRTRHDALELIREKRVVTEVPAHGPTSLVAEMMGEVSGSWREHAKGRLVYRIGRQLRASPEVLSVRLVDGKVAFVDRSLWPEVYRIAMEPERRRRSLTGLSEEALGLLTLVEKEGIAKLPKTGAWAKPREALEVRLLVHVSEAQNEEGEHQTVLRSWRGWAEPQIVEHAARLTYAEALQTLRDHCGGAPTGLGPWVF